MIIEAAHYSLIKPADWPGRFFKPAELADRETGEIRVDFEFLIWLDGLRDVVGPMPVNSGYRRPDHPRERDKPDGPGAHTAGVAVDIRCLGEIADNLLTLAIQRGAMGKGIRQHGPIAGQYLHLDLWIRKATWSYP